MTTEPNTNQASPAVPASAATSPTTSPASASPAQRALTNCQQATALAGKVVLFIGVECARWSVMDFARAAKAARAMGVDTIAPKRLDGFIPWYATAAHLREERAAVLAEGCGYLPFAYCYGPRFGPQQIVEECKLLAQMMEANDGSVCADMETEWNGRAADAIHFATLMRPVPGFLYVTSWADPYQQNWSGVTRALAPCVNAWVPQQYNNWLAARESQLITLGASCIQPALDLTTEFGANDPLAIARQARANGHTTIWLWEYQPALARQDYARQIAAVMGGSNPVPNPTPNPRTYTVQPGDTLEAIANKLGLPNWRTAIYNLNRDAIEATARAHGQPNSHNGDLIYPGEVLRY
ncbi:MAG TPA: LysM peptidoglycan-binding domain-containing protein [Ktedonobacterales bacterium]